MKMVELKTKVKHDSQVYYPGERRLLDDELAAYFVKHSWGKVIEVTAVDEPPVPSPDVTLEVHPGNHKTQGKVL